LSRHQAALQKAHDAIGRVMMRVEVGTADRPRRITNFEFALEHAEAWAADQPPKAGERGGSSNPRDASDRRENSGVQRRAAAAVSRLTGNALLVAKLTEEIERDVVFLTAITDDRPDESSGELPGCRSCARIQVFSAVYERVPAAKTAGLCRFCWEHGSGSVPPLALLEVKHNGTRRELSAWLAKNMPEQSRAVADTAPPCATTFFTTSAISTDGTHEFRCHRAQGHEGEHASVDQHGNRVVPALTVTPSC